MALQSQMARSGGGSGMGSRVTDGGRGSRDGQRRVIGVALLGALIVAGGYWYLNGRNGGGAARSGGVVGAADGRGDEAGATAGRAGAGGAGAAGAAPSAARPEPTMVEMWSGRRGENGGGAAPTQGVPATVPAAGSVPSGGRGGTGTAPAPMTAQATTPGEGTKGAPGVGTGGVRDPLMNGGAGSGAGNGSGNGGVGRSATGMNMNGLPSEVAALVQAGERAQREGRLLDARKQWNAALVSAGVGAAERFALRARLEELNKTLVFSASVASGDAMSESYTVEKGDSLVKIARKRQTVTEPGLIARVNGMSNPNAVRVGQTLKLVRGPFHAVVSKSRFRMDVYQGPTPASGTIGRSSLADGMEPGWTYICSFTVGLGEQGTTPVANFLVKEHSKLVNPFWVNPRTGEKYDADDAKNPIGERWIGLEGVNEKDRAFTGYGVHGTIDEQSIGQEMSMGCVRMQAKDVEVVYDLLTPRVSVVKVVE